MEENISVSIKSLHYDLLVCYSSSGNMFAHSSEEEFANILNFYHIKWEYEPKTFSLKWDEAGNVVESFTPDFYLPDLDLYIELTTMKQSLVTKKNRKVKLLRKLYPELNIKLFYGRDYKQLLKKYGIGGKDPEFEVK